MVTCCKECYPCCDFCIYAIHIYKNINGKEVKIAPQGCTKHPEEHYQSMARSCGYCKDFHCEKCQEEVNGT